MAQRSDKRWTILTQALHVGAAVRRQDFRRDNFEARANGVGFVLTSTKVAAVDLDKCRDPESGVIDQWAQTAQERTRIDDDPIILERLGATSVTEMVENVVVLPDTALALAWYQTAKDLGSAEAPGRLEKLARLYGRPR
jgi:hypothetical protein